MWRPSITPYDVLMHSHGPWEDHKYVKKVDDKYYYPNGYEDGRTISDLNQSDKKDSKHVDSYNYDKSDSDFDEKNYSDNNRLGDTNFYGFKGKDGQNVILMEDMKWSLPEGTKLNSSLTKKLEKLDRELESRRKKGEKISTDELNALVQDALEDEKETKNKSSKSSKKGSKSSKSGKSEKQLDKERRAKNQAVLAKRDLKKYKELLKERDKEYKRKTPRYMRHSAIWAPTPPEHKWR